MHLAFLPADKRKMESQTYRSFFNYRRYLPCRYNYTQQLPGSDHRFASSLQHIIAKANANIQCKLACWTYGVVPRLVQHECQTITVLWIRRLTTRKYCYVGRSAHKMINETCLRCFINEQNVGNASYSQCKTCWVPCLFLPVPCHLLPVAHSPTPRNCPSLQSRPLR